MSHINYNYLTESFLFGAGLDDFYREYSDSQLLNELECYREFVLNNYESIKAEILESNKKITVTVESFGNRPNEDTLKQLVLYMDCIFIEDPVFSMTETKSKSSKVMTKYLGMTDNEFDRIALVEAVKYMKDNTRLIVCNFIKFIPISLLHEAPQEIPIIYDKKGFKECLPRHIQDFLIDKIDVRNIVPSNGHLTVQLEQKLKKGTSLYLYFPDSQDSSGEIVFYQKMEKAKIDDNSNLISARFYIPDHISQYDFDNWLEQSKNRAALKFFNDTIMEYSFATDLGGMYLTKSQLRSDLLSMMWDQNFPAADIANLSMGIKLPVLQNLGIADIVEIREKYGESFRNFRVELGKELIKLRSIDDVNELKRNLSDLSYEINESNINDIDKELKKLKNSLGTDLVISACSLFASYIGSVNGSVAGNAFAIAGIATSAVAFLKDVKGSIKDYVDLKSNPGYFLWRMENKPWSMMP